MPIIGLLMRLIEVDTQPSGDIRSIYETPLNEPSVHGHLVHVYPYVAAAALLQYGQCGSFNRMDVWLTIALRMSERVSNFSTTSITQ